MAQLVFRHRPARSLRGWRTADVSRWVRMHWSMTVTLARRDPVLFLWKLLWLPFWIGSDAAAPALPWRRQPVVLTDFDDPAGQYLTTTMVSLTRKFAWSWLGGSILRGLTIGLFAVTAWAAIAIASPLELPSWPAVSAILVLGLAAGVVYGRLIRPDRLMVAAMLDHTFRLQERIVSAFDRPHTASQVSHLQLADAANTLEEMQQEMPRSVFIPVREAAIVLIMTGALVTMLLANVPQRSIELLGDSPVPQFVPASERLAAREQPVAPKPPVDSPAADNATIAEIQQRGRDSQSARQDLTRLGEALQDHPLTQPAADAIANGDYAAAADSLRSASDSASSMSQESRDALADDLDEAAQEISEDNPELAQAANDAASSLREGGPDSEEALSDLADQVDQTGEKVESQEDLAQDMNEAQSGSSESDPSSSDGSQGDQSQSEQSPGSSSNEQQSSDQGAASDPGEGSSAQPGVVNPSDQQDPSNSGSDQSQGSSDQGEGSSSSDGAGQEPTDGQANDGSGESSNSDSASQGDGTTDNQGLSGNPDDETDASQGSGAGTGQSNANDQTSDEQTAGESATSPTEEASSDLPSVGEAGDPPPSREDQGQEDDGTGTATDGDSNLELQGTSDEGVQSNGDSGTSSLGSGTGSTTANGDQSQGDVGVAGPDSNRVPEALRDIVKGFFEGPEP